MDFRSLFFPKRLTQTKTHTCEVWHTTFLHALLSDPRDPTVLPKPREWPPPGQVSRWPPALANKSLPDFLQVTGRSLCHTFCTKYWLYYLVLLNNIDIVLDVPSSVLSTL